MSTNLLEDLEKLEKFLFPQTPPSPALQPPFPLTSLESTHPVTSIREAKNRAWNTAKARTQQANLESQLAKTMSEVGSEPKDLPACMSERDTIATYWHTQFSDLEQRVNNIEHAKNTGVHAIS